MVHRVGLALCDFGGYEAPILIWFCSFFCWGMTGGGLGWWRKNSLLDRSKPKLGKSTPHNVRIGLNKIGSG